MRSPCYECELVNEDKNNDRCKNCKERIAYARTMHLISLETSNSIEEERMSNEVVGKIMTMKEIDINYKKVLQDIEDIGKDIPRRKGEKRGRKSLGDPSLIKRPQIYIKFGSKHFDVHQGLADVAELEHRTLSMQALYFIKEGIIKYKENHNE